jgi:hypothetical protein
METKQLIETNMAVEIARKGFIHLSYENERKLSDILNQLGNILFQSEIREKKKSTRLLASNLEMPFHTDHHEAKYIAWFCRSQSFTGGDSLLIDTKPIIDSLSDSVKGLLSEITVNSHRVFHSDKFSYPLIEPLAHMFHVYYAPWLTVRPGCLKHQKALLLFQTLIESANVERITLNEGDLLIIDNHRMLHGRSGFPSGSNRWLTRYWISDKNNLNQNQ